MITGYNTDVRYREKVFHVQTEDKGLSNPSIESVVYHGGQVLATKRASYSDLVAEGKGSEAIAGRMEHQHRMMIAAIKGGKLDAKLREVFGPAALAAADETRAAANGNAAQPGPTLLEQARDEGGPTLDQVILDYLTSEAEQEQLHLVLEEATDLALGNHADIQVRATSSRSGQGVPGAQVTVRMISTVAEPRTLAAGLTDEQGGLALKVLIPPLERGAAALIISASSAIGSAELKQLL
jgi:hypothetical protein